MARRSMPLRAARWSAEHPWRAVAVWVLFVIAGVSLGAMVSTAGTTDADYRVGDSGVADQLMTDHGLTSPPTESLLITARPGAALDRPAAEAAAREFASRVAEIPLVTHVNHPAWSANRDALAVVADLHRTTDDPDVTALQRVTAQVQRDHPTVRAEQVGEASLDAAINTRVGSDLGSAERISLPVTLVLMLLAFGALIAAGIPVLLAISAVGATIGVLAPLSHLIPMESTVSSMVLLIGMAVGVDYSLFYLKRAREERRRGRSTIDAVEIAAETSGHSIIVSGLAVIVSMAGLYFARDVTFNSLATGAILVVAVAVAGSVTVLPALLVKLGKWVDRPRIPFLGKALARRQPGSISRRILSPVLRRPVVALLIAGGAVAALALPALGMKTHADALQSLPQDVPQVQTMERLTAYFPSQGEPLDVVVQAPAADRARVAAALRGLGREAAADPVIAARGPAELTTSRDGTVSLLQIATTATEGTPAGDRALTELRTVIGPQHLDDIGATHWVVGGGLAQAYDTTQAESDALPIVIGVVLVLTLLMMLMTFRSVPIAIITTLLNIGSVGAAFGMLTLVFQHHWADGLLGYTSSGFVVDWIPLFTFVVLMGLSMDYHVFVLSRVREGVMRGLPPRLAVESGVSQTAGVVTSAAAVMVSVFAIFGSLSMLEMKQIGVGLAAAVLVDATLVRVVILPALLTLLGRAAWWPMRPRRLEPQPVTAHEPTSAALPEPAGVRRA